jgi:hypothetical protein
MMGAGGGPGSRMGRQDTHRLSQVSQSAGPQNGLAGQVQ